MANNFYRINSERLKADLKALAALRRLSDYAPTNPAASMTAINALDQALAQAREEESKARDALMAARDATIAVEWALHEAMMIAKEQVIAQYGSDSDAVQSLGLKKKMKRRRGVIRASNGLATQPDSR